MMNHEDMLEMADVFFQNKTGADNDFEREELCEPECDDSFLVPGGEDSFLMPGCEDSFLRPSCGCRKPVEICKRFEKTYCTKYEMECRLRRKVFEPKMKITNCGPRCPGPSPAPCCCNCCRG